MSPGEKLPSQRGAARAHFITEGASQFDMNAPGCASQWQNGYGGVEVGVEEMSTWDRGKPAYFGEHRPEYSCWARAPYKEAEMNSSQSVKTLLWK